MLYLEKVKDQQSDKDANKVDMNSLILQQNKLRYRYNELEKVVMLEIFI